MKKIIVLKQIIGGFSLQVFRPDCYVASIFDLPISLLKRKGIETICFDFDNTLVGYEESFDKKQTILFLKRLKKEFHLVIISNSFHEERVKSFAALCGITFVCKALKPLRHGFLKANIDFSHAAMVGDQLLTDILGAKRSHLFAILVDPIADKENKGTKVNRFFEKRIFHCLGMKRGVYDEEKM